MQKVVKFGGSSLADSNQFKKVKAIIEADSSRSIVVVSALGKRNKQDHKITDLLYLTGAHLKYGVDVDQVFDIVKERYFEVKNDLNLDVYLEQEFKQIEDKFSKNIDEEYLVSRGEYLAAKLMASFLGYTFVDAKDLIFFDYDGKINENKTYEALQLILKTTKKIVVPGFYGAYPDGKIHLLSRGGSDVTGSILAKASSATIYENWTDVSGFLVTDPRIVSNPKQIKEISYEELRELSYMGANVLHEDTIFPVQELDIPINVKNTNCPLDPGTIITSNPKDKSQIITGIAGKKDYVSITILKKQKTPKLTVIKQVLDVLVKYNVNVEHMPSSIDSFSLIVSSNDINKRLYEVVAEIKALNEVTDVIVEQGIALVAVVGRNMALKPGMSAKLFSIFGKNDINIKVIAQASQELSIIVGVENSQFEKAIKAIYEGLVK
ncbi:MAG: aspartate kinase [Erysipelotrichaceae bacterium]|nr:aspartate kinase [Erysipelotrichaceae bacterium]